VRLGYIKANRNCIVRGLDATRKPNSFQSYFMGIDNIIFFDSKFNRSSGLYSSVDRLISTFANTAIAWPDSRNAAEFQDAFN
jgi:hypothetical protein